MVADDSVVFQSTDQGKCHAVVPLLLWNGLDCLDALGILVRIVPLL